MMFDCLNAIWKQVLSTVGALSASLALSAAPIGVIVDTDIGSSTDDLLVLSTLRSMENDGLTKLLGVIVDRPCAATDEKDCFRVFTEAFLHAYDWDYVPIGNVPATTNEPAKVFTPYWKLAYPGSQVDEAWGDKPLLPPPETREGIVTDPVTLYRRLLASQPNNSVDICAVGFLTAIIGLMDSPADDISPMTGMELIAAKVRTLRIMAGSFDGSLAHPEYNVLGDVPAASKVFSEWPGMIVDTPFEVGSCVYLPRTKVRKAADPGNPIALVYCYWDPDGTPGCKSQLMWDVCTVLGMPEVGTPFFSERGPGRISVDEVGYTTFQTNQLTNGTAPKPGQQSYVQFLTNSLAGTLVCDAIQLEAFGKVTPDPARIYAIRITAVCSSNVVAGGIINVSNRSSEDFDLSGCHLTTGRIEDSNIIRYDFPTTTVIRAGATLTLRGAECWPGRDVWNAPMNVMLYTADWDVLHDTRVDPDWFKDVLPADGFLVSRENYGLMVDRTCWSVGCSSRHFTEENGIRATIRMDENGMPVVEPADEQTPPTFSTWGSQDLSGVWLTPADFTRDRYFRLTRE